MTSIRFLDENCGCCEGIVNSRPSPIVDAAVVSVINFEIVDLLSNCNSRVLKLVHRRLPYERRDGPGQNAFQFSIFSHNECYLYH